MNETTLNVEVLDNYPRVNEQVVSLLLSDEIKADDSKIVVLDDDPTGVQTVHDVSVYTDCSVESIRCGFKEKNRIFYILTNSRGMTASETTTLHKTIGKNIAQVSTELSVPYIIISRSDSTMRGHYPLETSILMESMENSGIKVDGEIIAPFFKEGGRFTIGNVHYVRQGNKLIPAAETEFAKDRTFGYSHSSIPEYIEEKTGGMYCAGDVECISIDSLRSLDYAGIEKQLMSVTGFGKICVNAVDYCDLKVFAVALYRAMARGKHFLFRSAAGLVKVMGGITDVPLLRKDDMITLQNRNGGIVVVGSYTAKTTAQLNELLKLDCVVPVEFNSNTVLDGDEAFCNEVKRCVALEEEIIQSGKTPVCFTCRKLIELENDTPESALSRSIKISDGVQSLVGRLNVTPAFIVAKGGITSSDVGVKALGVKKATVLGQIRPGIPVWKTGNESRFPGTPYVIFPGNTGDVGTLRETVEILTD